MAALPQMSEGGPPDPLARLGERLERARAARGGEPAAPSGGPGLQQSVGPGLRIGVELVVAVVVATAFGWALDRWLGTRPWGTIILFFLGVATGMVNVYRAVTGINTVVGYRRPSDLADRKRTDGERGEDEA